MTFASPWWLLALIAVPVIWWISVHGLSAVPRSQAGAARWVRTVILVLLVLSLAGLSVRLPDKTVATVFVVDVSDSISSSAKEDAAELVRSAIASKPVDVLAGVVVFGSEPRVELSLQEDPELIELATQVDPSRTDMARALRLAGALIPEGTRGRIVLISDGRQNSGDVNQQTDRLRERGIPVDTVGSSSFSGPDAAVVGLDAPPRSRVGDDVELVATVFSRTAEDVLLRLRRGEAIVEERPAALSAGEQRVSFISKATAPGPMTFTLEVVFPRDGVEQNDAASALVIVDGPARILVLEGSPGEGEPIAQALGTRGFSVALRDASSFPSAQELASTDAAILVDVEATRMSDLQVAILDGFVSELGKGLVTVGGESSFSLGGYRNSALESILPLESEIKDPRRRPSIAQVLAVDTSGSMGQCHCAGPNMSNDRLAQGPNKTNISREAAARAIDALNEDDEVGVLAFNTGSRWVIPLQKLPSSEVVRSGLQKLHASGGTSIPQAIERSVKELQASKASLKHVILFTDGWTNQEGLSKVAEEVRKKGITLSVVATGEGTGDSLKAMAEAGGGRFYAGRNLDEVPEIFMNEVILAARRYVNEGEFFPAITASSPTTDRLEEVPALLGYISTTAKPSAAVLMAVGDLEDPLLATWRRGVGVVTSWTSDAKARWSSRWLAWDGFGEFWSNVVRETLPAAPSPGFTLDADAGDGGIEVEIVSDRPIPEGATASAKLIRPDGTTHSLQLQRDSATRFSGTASSAESGTYLVSADLISGGASLFRDSAGAILAYPAEYRPGGSDQQLLERLARATGGRIQIDAAQAFDPPKVSGHRMVALSGWLLALAIFLLPVDIALRRVVITKEDLAAMRRRRKRTGLDDDDGRVSELLRAKYRVRQVVDAEEQA